MNVNLFNEILIKINDLSLQDLIDIHTICDDDFIPKLSSRVNLVNYCNKLYNYANIISLYKNNKLVGVLAIYCNDKNNKVAFISSVCILKEYRGRGLSKILMGEAIKLAQDNGFFEIRLEVGKQNLPAINLYKSYGFREFEKKTQTILMRYKIM